MASAHPPHAASSLSPPPVTGFEVVEGEPGPALSGIVTRITGYRETGKGHFRQQQPASLVIPLIISFGDPFAIGLGRMPTHNDRFGSFAAGLFAGPVIIDSFGASHCIQIDFTPLGARRFFRVPMPELTSRMIPLDAILGAEGAALRERLGNEPAWPNRFDLARRFAEARLAATPAIAGELHAAFQGIDGSGGRISISRLAAGIGWSRKHLAHRFREDIGVGPKTIARIVRFNRALGMNPNGSGGWAAIASGCGFADQAHMTREFQALAGVSPAFTRNRGA